MAIPVIMPRQGQSVESCIITKWFKKAGDNVSTGELLFSYETDKAAFDLESPADGILLEVFHGEGEEVPVLTNVAALGTTGEDVSELRPAGGTKDASSVKSVTEQPVMALVGAAQAEQVLTGTGGKIRISPRARKLAAEKGISFTAVHGSGPNGRIVVSDILNTAATGVIAPAASVSNATGYTDAPLSNVRKIISKAMHSSLQNSAQLTHHMSADVRRLLEARKLVKSGQNKSLPDITINDMVCYCVTKALGKFPEMNSHFLGDSIRTFAGVNLGLAVDTPRGLMVPAVIGTDKMSIGKLSVKLREVAEACRKGNVDPELLKSTAASFTVSNLGNYGVELFTPVINLPQAGILGVCTITHRPADLGGGTFGFIPVIGLSLTYDHRAVDGGPATLFLKEIKDQIEKFDLQKAIE
ncbi:MAG: dihydrolipoamide acetyltransferase family protein [Bacteroidales bacterium]